MVRKNNHLPQELLDEVSNCAQRLSDCPSDGFRIKQEFHANMMRRFGIQGATLAFSILSLSQARSETQVLVNHLEVKVTKKKKVHVDKSKRAGGDITEVSQIAGGDMTGVVGGAGNLVEMDVATYCKSLDKETTMDERLRQALKDGRQAIAELKLQKEEESEILSAYAKLTGEIKKPEPKKNLLKIFWGTISSVASRAVPLVRLGKMLAESFGIPFGSGSEAD